VEVVAGRVEDRKFAALYGREGRVVGVLGMNMPARVVKLRSLVEHQTLWSDGLAAARA